MEYWVYLLACHREGKFANFYTGYTSNMDKRVSQHKGNVKFHRTDRYTGRFDYVKLVWKRKCNSKAEALKLEKYVKRLSQRKKWDLVKKRTKI